jgi:RHS repeat-associated protein
MRKGSFSIVLCSWLSFVGTALAANAPPAMIAPGQFNVSATGAATYTMPIAVPPGTAGMVPSLSLNYSSQAGDGIEGMGWTLSGLPSISRCPRTLAQDGVHGSVNYANDDRLCMDGQRLTLVSGTYGVDGSRYRTEVEGFSKVIEHNDINSSNVYFEVWTKSGQHMEFGNSTDSQILTVGLSTNVVRAWAVNWISDTVGNYLTVTYNCSASAGVCTDTNRIIYGQAYPLRIDYTGHTSSPSSAPYNSVRFSYCSRDSTPVCSRGDSVPMYQAGALTQSTVLLWDIKTYQGSNLVYDYQLDYRRGSATKHSRLTSVTLCGVSTCLAPTAFAWQGGEGYVTLSGGTTETVSQDTFIVPGDFNGDGITDVLPFSGVCPSSYTAFSGPDWTTSAGSIANPGAGSGAVGCSFSSAQQTIVAPNGNSNLLINELVEYSGSPNQYYAYVANTAGQVQGSVGFGITPPHALAGDYNGDGITDYLKQGTPSSIYYGLSSGGFPSSPTSGPSYNPSTTSLGSADFDGDGCADLLVLSSSNSVAYAPACNPATSTGMPPTIPSGYSINFGDFNGDGKTDILLSSKTSPALLYLSTGTGFVSSGASLPSDWGKYVVQIGDWNGDGKADVLLVAPGTSGMYGSGTSHKLYLSTGTDFTEALDSGGSPVTISNPTNFATATTADWNSDGATDVWVQAPSFYGGVDKLYTFSYTPELITRVTNGIGASSNVSYSPLNTNGTFYGIGSNSYPSKDVDGALYVVGRVDASNGLGDCVPSSGSSNCYSSTYAYTGAVAGLTGRGFLGFASVTITDQQTGIIQTTNYDTACNIPSGLSAPYLECPKAGLITSQTKVCPATTCGSSVTLNSGTNTYTVTNLGGTSNTVELGRSVVASNDLNGIAMPTTTTDYTYDSFGNALTVNVAVYDSGTSTTSHKYTTNTYNNDTTNWYLGRLATTSVESIVGSSDLTRYSSFCYDSSTGLLTREVIEPGSMTCSAGSAGTNTLITEYTYDAYGHRTATTVSGGSGGSAITSRSSYAAYDSIGQFQTSATNALSQSEIWAYDERFAGPVSHTGPNGLTTTWTYDEYGRATLETRPDGTKTASSYAYCSGVNGGTASCVTYGAYLAQADVYASDGTTHIAPTSLGYFDTLSRSIAGDTQGFDGSTIRSSTQYDANGRVYRTSRPYFATAPPCPASSPCWTTFSYDTLGRVTQATMPDSSVTTNCFGGLTKWVRNSLGQTTQVRNNSQGLKAAVTTGTFSCGTDGSGSNPTTTYAYDAFDDLIGVTDAAGNAVTNAYDIRGNKTDSYDPDMGHWSYVYNALSQLLTQTDAKSQTTTLSYDLLGRALSRDESGLFSTWTFGTSSTNHDVGQLVEAKACTASGCSTVVSDRTASYDSLARPSATSLATGGSAYTYTSTYNATNGKIDTVTYPSGFVEKSLYNTGYGYLCRLTDNGGSHTCTSAADSHVLFTVNARDAELHLAQSTAGNGVVNNQSFDPKTGLIQSVRAGSSGTVASFDYNFDTIGNLASRADNDESFTEHFCYDTLNRLTSYQITSSTSCPLSGTTVSYDGYAMGNIVSKSDVGTYSYPASGSSSVRPHAVTSISGTADGLTNPIYSYDADGNMTCVSIGASCTGTVARSVSYTQFNMAGTIVQGLTSLGFTYDSEHHRIQQTTSVSGSVTTTTVYVNDPVSGAMSGKVTTASGSPSWTDYLTVDGQIVGQRVSGGAVLWGSPNTWGASSAHPFVWGGTNGATWSWFVLDHLGSVAVITDASSAVIQRLSYDAWGLQRNANGTAATCESITSSTTRGFTNQEQMSVGCLVNLNARIYNPQLGRFMAADPVVGDDSVPGAFNRYSYVLNNPLSFTDTSGLCFLGCFWNSSEFRIVAAIAVVAILQQYEVLAGLEAATGIITPAAGVSATAAASAAGLTAVNAAIAGGIAGGISTGTLKGAAFGALTGGLAAGVGAPLGAALGQSVGPTAGNFIAQGLVGGAISVAQGGNFGSGFLAAGFGSLTGGFQGEHFDTGHLIASAVLGGIGSELGGGKFANGAVTGAFSYAAGASYANDNEAGSNSAPLDQFAGPGASPPGIGHNGGPPLEDALPGFFGRLVGRIFGPIGILLGSTSPTAPPSMDEAPYPVNTAPLIQDLESIGGGTPRFVPTPKGATQFIFPNGTILRFDIAPGQYSPNQGPHINLQNAPGSSDPNIHIPVKPNG